jgi:uncharacterized damage-inducible protein DinB
MVTRPGGPSAALHRRIYHVLAAVEGNTDRPFTARCMRQYAGVERRDCASRELGGHTEPENAMNLTQLFVEELDREAARTRRTLEQVPLDRDDWKPHPKSMPLARLAGLVASMPSWVSLVIDQDELDLTPPPGTGQYQQPATSALVTALDGHVVKARESLAKTDDTFLTGTKWRLRAGGKVVMEAPRHIVLRDTFNHLAHHRGQLTVYLRLNDRTVPAIYGPSADDQQFA